MIALVDYGAGNLRSVEFALEHLSVPWRRAGDPDALVDADAVILPGVGAAESAMRELEARSLASALRTLDRPILGICLGMQLFFETSDEAPGVPGLGLLPGTNVRLAAKRVPHMGWNRVRWNDHETHYYFAHSYVARPEPGDLLATVESDGVEIPAIVGRGDLLGVRFHPEKSGDAGLELLEAFCRC